MRIILWVPVAILLVWLFIFVIFIQSYCFKSSSPIQMQRSPILTLPHPSSCSTFHDTFVSDSLGAPLPYGEMELTIPPMYLDVYLILTMLIYVFVWEFILTLPPLDLFQSPNTVTVTVTNTITRHQNVLQSYSSVPGNKER